MEFDSVNTKHIFIALIVVFALCLGFIFGYLLNNKALLEVEGKYDTCIANLTDARQNASDLYQKYNNCGQKRSYYVGEVEELEEEIKDTNAALANSNNTIKELNNSLNDSKEQIIDLERQINRSITISETREYNIRVLNREFDLFLITLSIPLFGISGIFGFIASIGWVKSENKKLRTGIFIAEAIFLIAGLISLFLSS
ncbi:hypothetical protein [Salinirussus salinus]|uniref:hypothetical protein n=1 Tax=Salinirussus salinus TaxID=1198300 RepID=UPI00135B1971|nr:hypothetical protein [Salinirussus salinus]